MGVDLLNIARSGVMSSQSQLGVTGHNIANVNTEGYHRQVAQQSAQQSQRIAGNFYGTGTYVSEVKRIYNDYAARELQIGQSAMSQAQLRQNKLSELDQLYATAGQAIPAALADMYADLAGLADQPDDTGLRTSVLNAAGQLADSVNQMYAGLDGHLGQINSQISSITGRINDIGAELANLNRALSQSGGEDMALLDEQSMLIQELSQYAVVNVIAEAGGSKSIMLGGSAMLVSAQSAQQLTVADGEIFPNQTQLAISLGDTRQQINGLHMGGELGALFELRDQSLLPAVAELDLLALGLADTFNRQQAQGLDLTGQVGQNLFHDLNDAVMSAGRIAPMPQNGGNGAISVQVSDSHQLTGDEFMLAYTAPSSYSLTNNNTGAVTPLTLTGSRLTGAGGFELSIDAGTVADGDRFIIRPSAGAAAGLGVALQQASGLAAASAVITPDPANGGDISLSLAAVLDRNAPNFPHQGAPLTFAIDTAANQYQVFDATGTLLSGVTGFTPPAINAYGMQLEVSSVAGVTERFTLDLTLASGDNTNALAMARLNEARPMLNGRVGFTALFEQSKQDLGSQARGAQIQAEAAEAIFQQAQTRSDSLSGVNLDEEAANLMRFQQAYQASARIMTTSQQIFDALISSLR